MTIVDKKKGLNWQQFIEDLEKAKMVVVSKSDITVEVGKEEIKSAAMNDIIKYTFLAGVVVVL